MKISYLSFGCFMFILLCCQTEEKILVQDKSEIIVLDEYNNYLTDTTVFCECEYIALETNYKSVMYGCNRVFIDGDTLFVWDKKADAIHLFAKSGEHISSIRNKGDGPFQYAKIRDVSINTDKKHLILSCDPCKLIVYDYQGNGLHSMKLPDDLNEFAYHNGFIYGYENVFDAQLCIFIYDESYQLVEQGLLGSEYSMKDKKPNTVYYFGEGQRVTSNSGCYLTNLFDNNIYQFTGDTIYNSYTINWGKHEFPSHLLSQNSSKEVQKLCNDNRYICSISEVVENDNYLFLRTNIGFCLYEKDKNKLRGFSTLVNSTVRVGIYDVISTNDENKLVGILNAKNFQSFIEYKVKHDKKWVEDNPELMKIYEKNNEESNPILLIYKFKSDADD